MAKSLPKYKKIIPLLVMSICMPMAACSGLGDRPQPSLTPESTITPIPSTPTQINTPLPPTETFTPAPTPPKPPAYIRTQLICNDIRGQTNRLHGYDLDILLGWDDPSDSELGFKVYRNGELIETLEANSTSFVDHKTLQIYDSGIVQYGISTYNDAGNSSKTEVKISYGCH